jgi:copper chaperone CopZ
MFREAFFYNNIIKMPMFIINFKMKTIKIVIALLVFATGIARAQFTKAELQVNGLNCALCAKTTERSLKELPFVSDVKPDLIHNIYVITFKNDQAVNFDQIGKKVFDEGFFVSSFKATFNFENVTVAGNYFKYGGDTFQVMNGNGKPLNGLIAVTLVDRGFAPRSVSKKYLSQVSDATPAKAGRIYHVTI